jgi:hypothetical protein
MNVSSIATTAISKAFDRFNAAAAKVAGAADPENPADTVDLAAAIVTINSAKIDTAVGVRLIRAEQEMVKDTLDIFA